jgi:thiol-disulfide isomerase/thioredoxin
VVQTPQLPTLAPRITPSPTNSTHNPGGGCQMRRINLHPVFPVVIVTHMKNTIWLLVLLTAAVCGRAQLVNQISSDVYAQKIAPSATAASLSEQMIELMRTVDVAEAAVLKTHGTNEAIWGTYASLNATSIPKIIDLAAKDPSSPLAFISCEWVVTNRQVQARVPGLVPYGFKAVELLRDHGDATNPAVAPVCWALGRNWDYRHKPSLEFLQEVLAKNPDREARGNATFALARLKKQDSETLEYLQVAPDYLDDEWRKAATEEAKTTDSVTVRSEAERLFESVIQTYSNFPAPVKPELTLGERAAQELYQLQHLWVGQVAPEIEGDDLDGQKLKLSDYRGKIVLLSFWGSWCGPCMAMIPHERKLVEGMVGKPFVIIGVNSDGNQLEARRAVENKKITWRSFWSGTNDTDGPIPTAWNVKAWPTVYVLDPKGIIRLKLEGFGGTNTDNLLNNTIDCLLKEH